MTQTLQLFGDRDNNAGSSKDKARYLRDKARTRQLDLTLW